MLELHGVSIGISTNGVITLAMSGTGTGTGTGNSTIGGGGQ